MPQFTVVPVNGESVHKEHDEREVQPPPRVKLITMYVAVKLYVIM